MNKFMKIRRQCLAHKAFHINVDLAQECLQALNLQGLTLAATEGSVNFLIYTHNWILLNLSLFVNCFQF